MIRTLRTPGRRTRLAAVGGVTAGVLMATVITASANDFSPGQGLTLYAESKDAGAIIKGNDVRMFGVKIGVVDDLKVVRNDTARLELKLTTSKTPIHTDAILTVRPVSLLGERYLDLQPGSASAPEVRGGYTFPTSQVTRSVDLDEVLSTVDQPTGTALSMLLQTLGEGVRGNGKNAAATIKGLAPSMQQTDRMVAVLNQQSATLQQLVDNLSPIVAAFADRNGDTTDQLLNSASSLLSATAAEQQQLRSTLDELPSTLASAQTALLRVSGLADQATPALAAARPFTDRLNTIAQEASQFSDAAGPAIASLKPVLAKARQLVAQAAPLVARLSQSSAAMQGDATNASAFLQKLTDHLGGLLDFISYWALTTNGRDGLSHYFRVQVIANQDTATSQLPVQLPAGTSGKALLKGGVKGAVKSLVKPDPDSATGLTVTQENSLLDFLLGGAS